MGALNTADPNSFARFIDKEAIEILLADAVLLDRYYIPTRYPNGLPDLTPGQVYFMQDAQAALGAAVRLLSKVSELMAEEEEGLVS